MKLTEEETVSLRILIDKALIQYRMEAKKGEAEEWHRAEIERLQSIKEKLSAADPEEVTA